MSFEPLRFPGQLAILLDDKQFKGSIPDLRDDDAQWLVDSLNTVGTASYTNSRFLNSAQALGSFSSDNPLHRKFFHVLRLVCGIRGILPTLVLLSIDSLRASGRPFATGGYCDVWKGTLGDKEIAIKALRVYNEDGTSIIRKVPYRRYHYFLFLFADKIDSDFARR